MKQIVSFILLLLMATTAIGQTKVIERSMKKAPEWLHVATPNFLVVTVNAPTMAEAQNRVIAEVRERIIQSVASHVSVTQTNVSSEVVTNDRVESSADVFLNDLSPGDEPHAIEAAFVDCDDPSIAESFSLDDDLVLRLFSSEFDACPLVAHVLICDLIETHDNSF